MRRSIPVTLGVAAGAVVAATVAFALPNATAAPSAATASGVAAAAPAVVPAAAKLPTREFLPMKTAQKVAEKAIDDCAKKGFPVTATVVDFDGIVIVQLRADGTTAASVDASKGKAVASAGFRSPTSGLTAAAATNPGLLQVPGFVILAGGLPIQGSSGVIGGIGVGGAPSGTIDEGCATVGLDAIK